MFICFDTEVSSKQFLERSDIKSYKDNELLVLSRYICALNCHLLVENEIQRWKITPVFRKKILFN